MVHIACLEQLIRSVRLARTLAMVNFDNLPASLVGTRSDAKTLANINAIMHATDTLVVL